MDKETKNDKEVIITWEDSDFIEELTCFECGWTGRKTDCLHNQKCPSCAYDL